MTPVSQLMQCPKPICAPYESNGLPNLGFNVHEMENRAELSNHDEYVKNYIKSILNDEEFQKDPQYYISTWKNRRGNINEIRHPEDHALHFFETHFPAITI